MKCEECPAFQNNGCYEHNADDFWCALGEDMESGPYDELGCNRKSMDKIEKDLNISSKFNDKAFSEQCKDFREFCENKEKEIK